VVKLLVKSHFFEKKPVIFASPLCGYTRLPFRDILASFTYNLIFTEMVSVDALFYKNKASETIYAQYPHLRDRTGIQLVGSKIDHFLFAIEKLLTLNDFQTFDINCGCPVSKVMKTGGGSALLINPDLIYRILSSIKTHFPHISLSAKIRVGINEKEKNYLEVSKAIEDAGTCFLTVHGRTQKQVYSGDIDYEAIKQIKNTLKIPIIGNGNIFTPQDAKKMLELTGVDGIMLSRGIIGNPWLANQIRDYLEHGEYQEISAYHKIDTMAKHFYNETQFEPHKGFRDFKKACLVYLKGVNNIKKIKIALATCQTQEEMALIIENLKQSISTQIKEPSL
jgi:tRNA-dihydrouridine synthase B